MTLDEVKALYDDASCEFSTLVGGIVYKNKAYIKKEEAIDEYSKQARLLGPLMIVLNFHLTGLWGEFMRLASVIIIILSWSVSRRLP